VPDPTVWSVPANGADEVVETFGFLTDIIGPSYRGLEKRSRLRQIALESIEFSFLADGREAQLVRSLIEGEHEASLAVPLWQFGSYLSGAISIGGNLLPITDAGDVPYRRSPDNGGFALVWQDAFTWELFSISSTSGAGVTTSDTATRNWAAGSAIVFPARSARLAEKVALRWLNTRTVVGRFRFDVDPI
jgi:hypothetical protein